MAMETVPPEPVRDLTASDILSPQLWARSNTRPSLGLDVTCTKIAVDFQSMTEATAEACIRQNLDALARSDAHRRNASSRCSMKTVRTSNPCRCRRACSPNALPKCSRVIRSKRCPGCAAASSTRGFWRFATLPTRDANRRPKARACSSSTSALCSWSASRCRRRSADFSRCAARSRAKAGTSICTCC